MDVTTVPRLHSKTAERTWNRYDKFESKTCLQEAGNGRWLTSSVKDFLIIMINFYIFLNIYSLSMLVGRWLLLGYVCRQEAVTARAYEEVSVVDST